MEQSAARADEFCTSEVTFDEVEERSGLDIIPSLASYKESSVEGQIGGLTASLGCS